MHACIAFPSTEPTVSDLVSQAESALEDYRRAPWTGLSEGGRLVALRAAIDLLQQVKQREMQ